MNRKPAVLAYPNSNNLGDYIQSIAAKQLIGDDKIAELDRDHLDQYAGDKVSLVMNGWFMEKPSNWPPSPQINPLFLSFHLNPTAEKVMLSEKGITYFKTHQPIGCRDLHTQRVLESKGIKTFFSACMTLSLKRSAFTTPKKGRKGIVVISPLERLLPESQTFRLTKTNGFLNIFVQTLKFPLKYIKYRKAMSRLMIYLESQEERIVWTSQLIDTKNFSEKERILEARKQLVNLANARLVITSRIHSALPAVAFETPVLFLSDGLEHPNQKSRLEGLDSFFPIINSSELIEWQGKQPEAKKAHLPFVKKIQKEIDTFFKD